MPFKNHEVKKNFRIISVDIRKIMPSMGCCLATDKINVDGLKVGYMYREESDFEADSGWRIFSGTESQDYVDNSSNTEIYDLNTIANYDPSIIPYLNSPFGTELERIPGTDKFNKI
ncbi:MAG: DUF2185 domain-containing protein [Saprospiraceae bacterium]|nr:DUF2185 domain-containing protein [Saprospiraceae bacterium]